MSARDKLGVYNFRTDNDNVYIIMITRRVSIILTTQQHVSTIKNPQIAPAVPTTHVKRMNNITPNIFWIHGKNTPISVPGMGK